MSKFNKLLIAAAASLSLFSCKKDKDPVIPVYTVPTTYNFSNVNDSVELKLLAMADQIVVAVNLANTTPATAVSAQKLTDMFNNANNYFNDSTLQLNNSGLKLADYCSPAAKTDLLNYFDSVGVYSLSAATASQGVAGTVASVASPSKKYLLSPNGVFYSQIIKKTFQGGLCGYQIANVYMTTLTANSVDNNNVIAGSGTAMEHNWDAAFGFFGVPVDFPTNVKGLRYWGSYSNQVDPGLHSNATVMNAFLKGRAAISAKDMTTKTAQAVIIINTFDKLSAAAIVQEMKETDANIDAGDPVAAYGTMSETLGFINTLRYNTSPSRIITDAQILQIESLIDATNPTAPNLYNFIGASVNTPAQIKQKTDAIRQLVGQIYGFSATDLGLL